MLKVRLVDFIYKFRENSLAAQVSMHEHFLLSHQFCTNMNWSMTSFLSNKNKQEDITPAFRTIVICMVVV